MAGTVKVSFNMPEAEVERLRKQAENEGVSVTDLLLKRNRIGEKLDAERDDGFKDVVVRKGEREKELVIVG